MDIQRERRIIRDDQNERSTLLIASLGEILANDFYVADVDVLYDQALTAGLGPEAAPRDAEWGERYFHITDPDGHEVSFARPLTGGQ